MDLGGWRWTGTRRSREQGNSSGSGEQGSVFLSREQGNSSSRSGRWIWKPGDIHPDIPASTEPPLGFGIHFPDGHPAKAALDELKRNNHTCGDYRDRELLKHIGGLLSNRCPIGRNLSKMPLKEIVKQYFDSPEEYERKMRIAMERKEAEERNWRLYGEPITREVCLESAYHTPEGCPYLEHVEEPWNATVGEGYKIVCYCCQKPRSEIDHPDGRWDGYASKILPTYTMIYRED